MADRYQRYESKGLALKMPTVDFTFATAALSATFGIWTVSPCPFTKEL